MVALFMHKYSVAPINTGLLNSRDYSHSIVHLFTLNFFRLFMHFFKGIVLYKYIWIYVNWLQNGCKLGVNQLCINMYFSKMQEMVFSPRSSLAFSFYFSISFYAIGIILPISIIAFSVKLNNSTL